MNRITILLLTTICLTACGPGNTQKENSPVTVKKDNPAQRTRTTPDSSRRRVASLDLPEGFTRIPVTNGSFAAWLRQLPLQKSNVVKLYNGQPKGNQQAHVALLDIPVGKQDLQQCADAIMRLRAEYFFAKQQFDSIVFTDNERNRYAFAAPYTRANLEKFLLRVFGMCGTASLEKSLQPVNDFETIAPGDVLIRGGFPGHAEIVIDMACNKEGEKIYLLAQGFMPAQDIHIVKNPLDEADSPWYSNQTDGDMVFTPEYHFYKKELRRWK
jgi:hypothetical protein